MRMSLLTNSLTGIGISDLKTIADWAAENGICELDVGPAVPLDKKQYGAVLNEGKVAIKMGIEKIVCSTGVTAQSFEGMGFTPEKSLPAVVELAKQFVDLAEKNGVRLCYENCPMMGNIATSPDMWEAIFDAVGSERLGLCYDPSHLVWQFIDPYRNIYKFADKIFHVHAKDTAVDREMLASAGVLQNGKWWRHRLPGLGDLDWGRIVDALYEIGYDQAICIEHEDPVWEGTEDKVKRGILKTRDHVSSFFM